ncbi:MAG: hypothetical protein M9887_12270 [Chitinophagales bacterium]|nr:hypothetical protein [Chitinophagales bacterium]
MQLPAMIILGLIIGWTFPKLKIKDLSWGVTLLIICMASLIFWMIPRSIDMTIVYPSFNRVMHVNMLLFGWILVAVFRCIIFEVKIVFLLMVSGMLLSSGITLRVFKIVLCSSFTMEQQRENGFYLLIIGLTIFVVTIFLFFRQLSLLWKEGSKG